jgi:hypothetical protein
VQGFRRPAGQKPLEAVELAIEFGMAAHAG